MSTHPPEEAEPLLPRSTNHDQYAGNCYETTDSPTDSTSISIGEHANARKSPDGDHDDDAASNADTDEDASVKRYRAQRLKEAGGWLGYLKEFSIFIPFVVPRKDRKAQFCIVLSLLCISAKRAFNILIPRQLGIVTDKILAQQSPYRELAVWLILTFLSNETGVEMIYELSKIPIKQYTYRRLTDAAFHHVMNLSMDFHSERDSAEVMKSIEQGESLANVLEIVVLDTLPTVVDLMIAIWLLCWKFNVYAGLSLLIASVVFISLGIFLSGFNIDNRRAETKAEAEEARVMHQAVQGWQTVTFFNATSFERRRYGQAVEGHLTASRKWANYDTYMYAILEILVPLTFFTLACMILYEISRGRASPGDFVFFVSYWEYLLWPMKWISHNYRYLVKDFVAAERLLQLLQTKPTVADCDDAHELRNVDGHVAFENVSFSYDAKKTTIKDLSISAKHGQTIAIVGETGAGKSSMIKLLLRLYDVTSGRITIDGHDIREVTLSSLREAIGVVPQDPYLFNASILDNVRYASPSASDIEVFQACRAAAIHDKILGFPDGYDTEVGEQGVKLSGGEIQRLAIARVFLKNPPILILDEATSAVDTNTESMIQGALTELIQGRTTFIIAHRLSTIISADKILVVHEGQVVESGTHVELVNKGGRYNDLWAKQVGATPNESLI